MIRMPFMSVYNAYVFSSVKGQCVCVDSLLVMSSFHERLEMILISFVKVLKGINKNALHIRICLTSTHYNLLQCMNQIRRRNQLRFAFALSSSLQWDFGFCVERIVRYSRMTQVLKFTYCESFQSIF